MPKPPEHARLKDSDVERFVVILKPVAMLAVYSKSGSFDAAASLQNLALIKPDLILPSLIERYVHTFSKQLKFIRISRLRIAKI